MDTWPRSLYSISSHVSEPLPDETRWRIVGGNPPSRKARKTSAARNSGLTVFAWPLAPGRNPAAPNATRPARGGLKDKEVKMGNGRTLDVMVVPVGGLPYCKTLEADRDGSFLHGLQACVAGPIEPASYIFEDAPAVYVNEEGLLGASLETANRKQTNLEWRYSMTTTERTSRMPRCGSRRRKLTTTTTEVAATTRAVGAPIPAVSSCLCCSQCSSSYRR